MLPLQHAHAWNLAPTEAIALQQQLRQHLILTDAIPGSIDYVAGIDVGFEDDGKTARAAVAVLDFPSLQLVEKAIACLPASFPYIPGLLSFREIPAVLLALEQLTRLPDLLLCDGQGYAHPRRFGIACHLGLLLNIPSIGVGKTRLLGQHDRIPDERGGWAALQDREETIGAVLRTRNGVKPLYISAGHRVSLASAIDWTLRCVTRYRLPETTRRAHRLASE